MHREKPRWDIKQLGLTSNPIFFFLIVKSSSQYTPGTSPFPTSSLKQREPNNQDMFPILCESLKYLIGSNYFFKKLHTLTSCP